MAVWLPGYTRVDLGQTGGPYDRTDNPKLCWHTTEGGSLAGAEGAFYPYPPHLGVDPDTGAKHQYIDLDRRAYSLGNSDAEDSYVIQVEVVGYAGESHDWPPARLEWLGEHVVAPVADTVGVPPVIAPQGFHGEGEGIILASSSSPIRFDLAGWDGFAGHVGHQHCPGDDHWDPGRLDIARIIAAAGDTRPAPAPEGDDDMAVLQQLEGGVDPTIWVVSGATRHPLPPTPDVGRLIDRLVACGQVKDAKVNIVDAAVLSSSYDIRAATK